jgi:hypothetical protein
LKANSRPRFLALKVKQIGQSPDMGIDLERYLNKGTEKIEIMVIPLVVQLPDWSSALRGLCFIYRRAIQTIFPLKIFFTKEFPIAKTFC